jgi:hypothetical protein
MADDELVQVNDEQVLYARILEVGVYVGLALLLITFGLYVLGIVPPAIPLHELPSYWTLSVHEYLDAVDHDHLHHGQLVLGWSWLRLLGKSDFLNYLGIAMLSAVTIVCYLGIVPTLLRKRDGVYAAMAITEVVILALAASGVLNVGH